MPHKWFRFRFSVFGFDLLDAYYGVYPFLPGCILWGHFDSIPFEICTTIWHSMALQTFLFLLAGLLVI